MNAVGSVLGAIQRQCRENVGWATDSKQMGYGVAHILSENEQSPTTIKESDGVRVRPSIRLPSEGEPS
jgi:hypothetical protein